MRRQIFFCAAGGYDTHDDQVAGPPPTAAHATCWQSSTAPDRLLRRDGRSSASPTTSSRLHRLGLRPHLRRNGDGSDHGWGSHHLVLGGAVRGGRLYGALPALAVDGPDDTGDGRWIPTTSVDEYSATLARWFGVAAADLPLVFPNLGRFAAPNLGFLG